MLLLATIITSCMPFQLCQHKKTKKIRNKVKGTNEVKKIESVLDFSLFVYSL